MLLEQDVVELVVFRWHGDLHLALRQVRLLLSGADELGRTALTSALQRAAGRHAPGHVQATQAHVVVLRRLGAYPSTSSKANLARATHVMDALRQLGRLTEPMQGSFRALFREWGASGPELALAPRAVSPAAPAQPSDTAATAAAAGASSSDHEGPPLAVRPRRADGSLAPSRHTSPPAGQRSQLSWSPDAQSDVDISEVEQPEQPPPQAQRPLRYYGEVSWAGVISCGMRLLPRLPLHAAPVAALDVACCARCRACTCLAALLLGPVLPVRTPALSRTSAG